MTRLTRRSRLLGWSALGVLVLSAGNAHAQQGPGATDLEELIVTAQRRAEGIQDVPVTIAAVTGEVAEKYNAVTAKDLVNLASGVFAQEAFGTNPIYVIRGIGLNDYRPNSSPSAAVYVDEVAQTNMLSGSPQAYDLERVEILKGPQGTLYGRNASSGAVNIITKRPTPEYGGYAKAAYGRFQHMLLEGAFGGPITDNLMFRLSGQFDDYGKSVFKNESPVPQLRQVRPGKAYAPSNWGLRGQLLWLPTDQTEVLFKLTYREQGGAYTSAVAVPTEQIPGSPFTCPGNNGPQSPSARLGCQTSVPGDLTSVPSRKRRTLGANFPSELQADFWGGSLRVEHDFGWAELTSITAYDGFTFRQNIDVESTIAYGLHTQQVFKDNAYSQEFRLAGDRDALKWMIGVNAFYDDYKEPVRNLYAGDYIGGLQGSVNYSGAAGRVGPDSPRFATRLTEANALFQRDEQPTTSYALFTDNEFNLFGDLSLVVGYRYTYEKRRFRGEGFVVFQDGSLELSNQFNLGPAQGDNAIKTKRSSGRIGLNWRPSTSLLGYATFSESFKSGGFDGAVLSNASFFETPYEAEVVRSVEVGFKSDPLPNLRLNGAVFYTDFDSPQTRITIFVPGPTGPIPQGILSNLDSARIYGVEGEFVWRPVTGLTLSGSTTLLDTKVSASGANAANFDGKPLSFAPKVSVTLNGLYEFPIGSALRGRVQANMKHASRHAVRPEAFPIDFTSYTMFDAQVAVTTVDEAWEVALSGRNLTDERYATTGIQGFNAIAYNQGLPRTWMISVNRRF